MRVCASCGGNCRTGSSPDAPDTEADGSAVGCRNRRGAFACGLGQQGGDWLRGWRNADGKRYFSGILAECGVVFNGAYVDCSGGVVWTHCEA